METRLKGEGRGRGEEEEEEEEEEEGGEMFLPSLNNGWETLRISSK